MRSARAFATEGGATTLAPDRDAEGVKTAELDERDDAQDMAGEPDNEQDDLVYASDADADASADAANADLDEDSEDVRALALPDRSSQAVGAPAQRYQRGGVYVPEFLMGNSVTRWLAEAYIELRKVTWPTPNTAWTMTLIVILVSALVALVLGGADFGLTRLVTWLSGLTAG
jgi:preprotein translocase SecE subunit